MRPQKSNMAYAGGGMSQLMRKYQDGGVGGATDVNELLEVLNSMKGREEKSAGMDLGSATIDYKIPGGVGAGSLRMDDPEQAALSQTADYNKAYFTVNGTDYTPEELAKMMLDNGMSEKEVREKMIELTKRFYPNEMGRGATSDTFERQGGNPFAVPYSQRDIVTGTEKNLSFLKDELEKTTDPRKRRDIEMRIAENERSLDNMLGNPGKTYSFRMQGQ